MKIDELFREMITRESSDLHLKVGRPPLMRLQGELLPTEYDVLTSEGLRDLVYPLLRPDQVQTFEHDLELDFAHTIAGQARYRVNLFHQRGELGMVCRMIPLRVPTISEMNLPDTFKEVALRRQGLILVTGPTGSGKSTSMAAMVQHINENQYRHVVTLEDPIEFVHTDLNSTINQRELGLDTRSLDEALKHVLRQDPDVILIGEMRDPSTMETAMRAAETGHLVLSTLHTNDAKQSMDRILDSFSGGVQGQVRTLLSLTLLAVFCQRLVGRADGAGRVAAVEIMVNSPAVAKLLAEGHTRDLEQTIAKSTGYYGMRTFNQALCQLVVDGVITPESALANSSSPSDLHLMLKGIGSGSSAIDTLSSERETPLPDVETVQEEEEAAGSKMHVDRGFEF